MNIFRIRNNGLYKYVVSKESPIRLVKEWSKGSPIKPILDKIWFIDTRKITNHPAINKWIVYGEEYIDLENKLNELNTL